jgi:RND family efflux transporter MFP subunit
MSELTAPAPRSGTRTRGTLGRVVLIVLVAGLFIGLPLGRYLLESEPQAAVPEPTRVATAMPVRADAEETVRYSGNLVPESSTVIIPKTSGRVTRILVSENQTVTAGQLLVEIEDDVLQLQLEQAQAAYDAADAVYRQALRGVRSTELAIVTADVEQAEADLENARSSLARSERLFEAGAIARSEYESAQNQFSSAETAVENARRQLSLMEDGAGEEELTAARANAQAALRQVELAELQLGYASITAPVAGTVASVMTEQGQLVGPSSPLISVVNDTLIRARIQVPERLYGKFRGREGQMVARVYPEAYSAASDEPFVGRVSTVAGIIDAASRTFEVEVAIPNADGRLRPGMYVSTIFVLETYENALQIPESAVVSGADGEYVFVVADDIAEARPVVTIDVPGPDTVVLSGVSETDAVIVEGLAFLDDGAAVEVVEQR